MPELPEVETIVKELRPKLTGSIIKNIEILWPNTFQEKSTTPWAGQQIKALKRKGKYIIFQLQKSCLIIHLRMTGQLLFAVNEKEKKHVRAIFHFQNGHRLYFRDVRKFGRIYYINKAQEILAKVGTDGLDPNLDEKKFAAMLQNRRMNIKAFLLSQKYISGLGNIYVDESLFRAEVHPVSIAGNLPTKIRRRLFEEIRFVLNFAVEHMGSTISDYRDAFGESGTTQKFFQVYQRGGQPCFKCGTKIEKIRLAGRGTHFCPKCQIKY